jgi:hypothetical protein
MLADPAALDPLHRLRDALDEGHKHVRDTWLSSALPEVISGPRWHTGILTDTVVVVYAVPPYKDDVVALSDVLDNLSWYQTALVRRGFPTRGAIAVGDAYVDGEIVNGPALIEAYLAEQGVAKNPRIMLCDSARLAALEDLRHYGDVRDAPQWRDLRRDTDGVCFLDYLNTTIHVALDELGPDFETLDAHRDAVQQGLVAHASDAKVLAKHEWVAAYHNHFCDRWHYSDAHKIEGVKSHEDQPLA